MKGRTNMKKSEMYQEAMRCVLMSSRCSHDEIIEIIAELLSKQDVAAWTEEQEAKPNAAD